MLYDVHKSHCSTRVATKTMNVCMFLKGKIVLNKQSNVLQVPGADNIIEALRRRPRTTRGSSHIESLSITCIADNKVYGFGFL